MLKQFIKSLHPIFDALENTTSELLNSICNVSPEVQKNNSNADNNATSSVRLPVLQMSKH